MKRRAPPVYPDTQDRFDHVETLVAYLEYAICDVEAVSRTSASLLKLAIANLKDEDDQPEPTKPLLS